MTPASHAQDERVFEVNTAPLAFHGLNPRQRTSEDTSFVYFSMLSYFPILQNSTNLCTDIFYFVNRIVKYIPIRFGIQGSKSYQFSKQFRNWTSKNFPTFHYRAKISLDHSILASSQRQHHAHPFLSCLKPHYQFF